MTGFQPPPYPYDRLDGLKARALELHGHVVDLSVGTPNDPPPSAVVEALGASGTERGYPPSAGTARYRQAAVDWMARRFGLDVPPTAVAACIGTKEFVGTLPQWLRLRSPERDTVLYPAVSYPTYAMGATLAGCRGVPVPVDEHWRLRLDAVADADVRRTLCLWVNTPNNPTGALDDLSAVAAWGRARRVPVISDECYVEFTWDGTGRTILSEGLEGVLAVHSLSKRSNLAGARAGFYAGDPELVHYLREVRKHVGLMVPGPVQAAAAAALDDDDHVIVQRQRYHHRLEHLQRILRALGVDAPMPQGGFYLWAPAPEDDAWGFTERLALEAGVLVSPGDFYGPAGATYVRAAVVQPVEQLDEATARLTRRDAVDGSGS